MALTAKKKAFAQAKHDGADNKEAAIFAGYSPETASQAGSRLAKDPDVIAHIERLEINIEVKVDEKVKINLSYTMGQGLETLKIKTIK